MRAGDWLFVWPAPNAMSRRSTYAILITDVYHFSQLVAQNEERTINTLAADFKLFKEICAEHGGEVNADRGDSLKMVFESPVEAFRAAVKMQEHARKRAQHEPDQTLAVRHRMGLHFGDVMRLEESEAGEQKITGSAVTIAARLEEACSPGQICFSNDVHQMIKGHVDIFFRFVGSLEMKNIPAPVRAWMTGWDDTYQIRGLTSVQDESLIHRALDRQRVQFEEELRRRRQTTWQAIAIVTIILGAFSYGIYAMQAAVRDAPHRSSSKEAPTFDPAAPEPDGMGSSNAAPEKPPRGGPPPIVENSDPKPNPAQNSSAPSDNGPTYFESELEDSRSQKYREMRFGDFAAEISAIANWKTERQLAAWHREASELAAGLAAFKAMVRSASTSPITSSSESSQWQELLRFDGTNIVFRQLDQEVAKAVTDLTVAEMDDIYRSFLRIKVGGNSRVERFLSQAAMVLSDI